METVPLRFAPYDSELVEGTCVCTPAAKPGGGPEQGNGAVQ
jgi:hypothetical protein